jgi:ribonuclease P/MRP protein subunit RPP40
LGPDGRMLEWIRMWLEDRKERVVLNGEASEWADVLSVPQGSVLGPI